MASRNRQGCVRKQGRLRGKPYEAFAEQPRPSTLAGLAGLTVTCHRAVSERAQLPPETRESGSRELLYLLSSTPDLFADLMI